MTLILLLLLDALHPWGHSSLIVSHGKIALASASLTWGNSNSISLIGASLVAQKVENLPANAGDTKVEKKVGFSCGQVWM